MSRPKSCDFESNCDLVEPKTGTEHCVNYIGTRSRDKNLKKHSVHNNEKCDSKIIKKLKKLTPQHQELCGESSPMGNTCESEIELLRSNILDSEKHSKAFDNSYWTNEMESNFQTASGNKTRMQKPKCERANRKEKVELKSFQPSDWLSSIKPRKLPFYPQMGDEVMYFRQGHEMYAAAVEHKHLYVTNPESLPWTNNVIRQQEWVKIIGIEYEIKPPRLICLKLGLVDPTSGVLTRKYFDIEYHDMDDVPDFLVLKQDYDAAIKRPWKHAQQFRSLMNDDSGVQMWWEGQFVKREPLDAEFPESMFLCYWIRWDNGEWDRLSPWDLENIDPGRRPYETGASVQLLPIEISSTLYTPKTDDWPPQGDRDFECDRISEGISQVMSLNLAKHFFEPVNLELFPNYAFVVKYPVDLSTIKARLDHRFYRRASAVEYDVRRIHTNALTFNDPEKSDIVRNSSIITDLCLEIIRNSDLDIKAFYLQLLEKYEVSGIKVKKSVPPNEKRQIEQSSSFALTFTNVVTGSNKTSASVQKSRPKLVFNSSQGSSSLVSSNRISVKVSSSFAVDEPISDEGLTATNSHKPCESLNHQNSHNSETNTSRMRTKVTSPVGTEVEQSPKRRKMAPGNASAVMCSDDQFSDVTMQECDNSLATQNASSTRKSTLKKTSKKENLDTSCTTASLPGIDDDDTQADINAKSVPNSHYGCSSMGISQKGIFSPRAMNKHLNLTRIHKKEMGTRLNRERETITTKKTPALFSPFLTPIPLAVSTPMKVHRRQSSLFKSNSFRGMGKNASENLLRHSFGTEKRSHRKLKLGGWNITFDDCPKGFGHTNEPLLPEKSPQLCLSKQVTTMFENVETADWKSCDQSETFSYQCPEVKTTYPVSVAEETSKQDASYPIVSRLSDFDTYAKQVTENQIRVECPFAAVTVLPNPNDPADAFIKQILDKSQVNASTNQTSFKEKDQSSEAVGLNQQSALLKKIEIPLALSADALIEQILAEPYPAILKKKTSKNKSEKKKKVNEKSEILSTESADALIEQILAESNRAILKQKTSKKKSEKVDKDCPVPFKVKSKYRKNDTRNKDPSASNVIALEEDKSQWMNKEVTLTPTNIVDRDSCEGDRFSTAKEVPSMERKGNDTTNKTSYYKKHKSSAIKGQNQHSAFPTEHKSPSLFLSTEELIEKILVESLILKPKKSKRRSEKKKESKSTAIPRCIKVNKNVKDSLQVKSRHEKNYILTEDPGSSTVASLKDDEKQTSTLKKMPTIEHQVNVSTNKTTSRGKKDKSSEAIGQNQQYVYSEEIESPSSESADTLIEQILAESKRAIRKQKASKKKSENKKKESKLSTFPRLSNTETGCQEPFNTKSKDRNNDNRVANNLSASVTSRSLKKDSKEPHNKLNCGSEENLQNCSRSSREMKIVDQLLLSKLGSLTKQQSESKAHILNGSKKPINN